MQRHSNRTAYYVIGEGLIVEPPDLFSAANCFAAPTTPPGEKPLVPPFKFGRLFRKAEVLPEARRVEMIKCLGELGKAMNKAVSDCGDSTIPSGYTYLGQFIAHEITFDKSDLTEVEMDPGSWRSPQIDLDSLYGGGPHNEKGKDLYEDDWATLKIGSTTKNKSLNWIFPNDLRRDQERKAIIGDERNDENLPVAQIHLAFSKFHNGVVSKLKATCPAGELFEQAQTEVVRHFQWIILMDYLPRIVDTNVLECVLKHGLKWFKVEEKEDLFMPLEFSAAAFRFGHSMVRPAYEWNHYHASPPDFTGKATLGELFEQTRFSNDMAGQESILSEWIIDWRRFFSFEGLDYEKVAGNMARRIDTFFDLHLDQISGYPHHGLVGDCRSITVRNLLRGFSLGLPTGEEVARRLGETPLTPDQIASAQYQAPLATALKGKTPLWFYILREAELEAESKGVNHLGSVGSRIVAETLVGLIKNSSCSIFDVPGWTPNPSYSHRRTELNSVRFEMADLLDFADVVDPIGRRLKGG